MRHKAIIHHKRKESLVEIGIEHVKNRQAIIPTDTKEKLIQTGIRLFSKYGFEATTMRMIAKEADVNIATISFHFENKKNFYRAVLEYAAENCDAYYDEVYENIALAKESGILDQDKAWDLIDQLLSLQLYMAINQPWPEYISLLYWEQIQPPEDCSPLTETVNKKMEGALAFLLTQYEPSLEYSKAILISRFISGGIITFGEHPAFTNYIKEKIEYRPIEDFIKETLKPYILSSIAQYCRP